MPATVVLPAGQTTVSFDVTMIDDHVIDGDRPINVTAHVENWTDGTATMIDAEGDATLTVTLPGDGWEGQVLSGEGVIQLGGITPSDLVVSLASGDTTELGVPDTVTIPAGQSMATFDVTLVSNHRREGPQDVQVTATADKFTAGSTSMLVRDSDVDHFTFDPVGGPETAGVPFWVSATACDIDGNPIWVYDGTAALSGAGSSGPLSIGPAAADFSSGYWSASVTVNAVDPAVTLTLDDGAGAAGSSDTFTVRSGPVATFQWSTIDSPQADGISFPVTLTAKDANGYTVDDFNGSASLTGKADRSVSVTVPPAGPVLGTDNFVLSGNDLQLGINANGTLIEQSDILGANFLGNEFLAWYNPQASFTLSVEGTNYHNGSPFGPGSIPMIVSDVSASGFLHAQAVGDQAGIHIVRDIFFGQNDDVVTFHVVLTNTTDTTLDNLAWLENYNPDQGYGLDGDPNTYNDVLFDGHFAEAWYYDWGTGQALTIGIGSDDGRAVAATEGFGISNPFQILESPRGRKRGLG